MMNQREAMSILADHRARFNPIYFERDEDKIIEELKNVILSCQRNNEYFSIRVDNFRVVDNYDEINQILFNYYDSLGGSKPKNKKRDNQYAYINLNESYIRLLIVKYFISDKTESDYLEVIIGVPRIIDKYYFLINGIMRSTLFQIVDGSTYNNGTSNAKVPSVTLKIVFMAARITRYYYDMTTTSGEDMKVTYYHSRVFNKGVPAVKYIFAKHGFYRGLQFLGLEEAVYVTNKDINNPEWYTFAVDENIFISSPKVLFDKNPMLQSVVSSLHQTIVPGINYENIFDDLYWVRSLGLDFSGGGAERMRAILDPKDTTTPDTIEKGYNILDSFENIFDISTRESIKLPPEDKSTTYHIFRWIMREFNSLRLKENLDVGFKRIRFAEYIASLYAFKIARGIYRVSDMNKRATIVSIRKAIRTDPNYLLNAICKSKMVSYRNMVSDMDSMQALKFTYKGVSGLGEGSNDSIPDIYRTIHKSHLGRLDLDASSDGNPGITGTICPFAPNYDGFFQEYEEPNSWESEFLEAMEDYKKAFKLKDALIFEEKLLGNDKKEEIKVTDEIIASMQQIIKPVINADLGDFVSIEEVF
ncbi:MAG: hypothetical protein NC489_35730 [Ruminococcus flavefaciens]|nr:hypothetical protein [Ruminococcus flavefaciens]